MNDPAHLRMAPTAVSRVAALPEFWALVAEHAGFVGAWRLMGVCSRVLVGVYSDVNY